MAKSAHRTFSIDGRAVSCTIRRSRRSRHIRLTVRHDDSLLVTMPLSATFKDAERIIEKHRSWIFKRLQAIRQQRRFTAPFALADGAALPTPGGRYRLRLQAQPQGRAHWLCRDDTLELHIPEFTFEWIAPGVMAWYKGIASIFLNERVSYWAQKMKLVPHQVKVKNQRTTWGSCSRQGNLNFNWRIMLLSAEAIDYLILHELAHLAELNHSPGFWRLVSEFCPHFKIIKKEIRGKHYLLGFPQNLREA